MRLVDLRRLARLVARHRARYERGSPTLSDAAFDRLDALLSNRSALSDNRAAALGPRGNAAHLRPMRSLLAVRRNDTQALESFFRTAVSDDVDVARVKAVAELKYDGIALAARYRADGTLKHVATRGDGLFGVDVSSAARNLVVRHGALPDHLDAETRARLLGNAYTSEANNKSNSNNTNTIEDISGEIEVRGEALLARARGVMRNARNVAAGLLMREKALSPNDLSEWKNALEFRAYDVALAPGVSLALDSYLDVRRVLADAGFGVCQANLGCVYSFEDAMSLWQQWADEEREKALFDADGLVLKFNSIALREELGFRFRSPRWAIALKFVANRGETDVKRVDLHVGRHGTITPVATLEPVRVAGALLARASLHNLGRAFALQLYDPKNFKSEFDSPLPRVIVERGGDVIPYIVSRADLDKDTEETLDFGFDHNEAILARGKPQCPCEQQSLLTPAGANQWRCIADNCLPRAQARRVFLSKALNLAYLGENQINLLSSHNVIRTDADLLRLPALKDRAKDEDGKFIHRLGDKSFERMSAKASLQLANRCLHLQTVANSETRWISSLIDSEDAIVPLWRAIAALGAEHVGSTAARGIAKHFLSFSALVELVQQQNNADLVTEELEKCENVGAVGAQSLAMRIRELLATSKGRDLLYSLALWAKHHNKENKETIGQTESQSEIGFKFAITGSLANGTTRTELAKLLQASGHQLVERVNKSKALKPDFVVVCDNARPNSDKQRKAEALDIPLLTEQQFLDKIGESTTNNE